MAAEIDLTAARLQLAELQSSLQILQDSRAALQLHLCVELDTNHLGGGFDLYEEQQLQEQVAVLQGLIAVAEDQQYALASIAADEAAQAASLQLATALDAREQWEASVLRPHDAALARAIAGCSAEVWSERGLLLERPLDLTDQPAVTDSVRIGPSSPASAGASPVAACSNDPVPAASPASSRSGGSTAPHDPSSDSRSSQEGRLDCGICFEAFPAGCMVSATLPAGTASSSRAAGRCGHTYCTGCLGQYITCELQARKHPLSCPHPGCGEELAAADVTRLLADQAPLLQVYQALEAEQLIALERRVYCPYKDCSVLLERPEPLKGGPADDGGGQEAPYECPECNRSFCVSCGITGWHTGFSCREYQELPPELRSAEDAAMLHIAKEKQWKRCPSCGHFVERTAGCNHMVCRCGCDFCYACGTKYTSRKPSANNAYGTQGCGCALFSVPDEPVRVQAPAARPVVLRAPPGAQGRPIRNRRRVSSTPCRHARSIYDCPHGPGRCWFWHEEDDEFAAAAGE